MKFTKEQVKQIIKEEIEKYVFEVSDLLGDPFSPSYKSALARAYPGGGATKKPKKSPGISPPTGVPTEKGYPLGFVSDPMYDTPERQEIENIKSEMERQSIVSKPGWAKAETIDGIQAWADTLGPDEIKELETIFPDEEDMDYLLRFGAIRPRDLAKTELLDLLDPDKVDPDKDLTSAVQKVEAAAESGVSQKIKDVWKKLEKSLLKTKT
jgi:hypothetical protein